MKRRRPTGPTCHRCKASHWKTEVKHNMYRCRVCLLLVMCTWSEGCDIATIYPVNELEKENSA